jgi:misacylated tRNA(Ala) deacylase
VTTFLFRDDAYLASTPAVVVAVSDAGVTLDQTIFYATSGGQPGDTGRVVRADGTVLPVIGTIHPDGDKSAIVHQLAPDAPPLQLGEAVTLELDWERRLKLMRMHTALHLVTVVLPYPITGAAVGEDKGRVDFNLPEVPDAAEVEAQLNELVARDLPVTTEWITDEELAANPGLVKSMNVKPPMGMGRVRLVRIGDVDLQPCGGTHVASTGEIGRLKIGKIEKKGAINRRISVLFAD